MYEPLHGMSSIFYLTRESQKDTRPVIIVDPQSEYHANIGPAVNENTVVMAESGKGMSFTHKQNVLNQYNKDR